MRLTRLDPAVALCGARSVVDVAFVVVVVAALRLVTLATLARRVVVVATEAAVDVVVVFEVSERVGRRREGRVVVGMWD